MRRNPVRIEPAFASSPSHHEAAGDLPYGGVSRKDSIAGALALVAVGAIVVNALFLQKGRHPSPIFPDAPATVSVRQPQGAAVHERKGPEQNPPVTERSEPVVLPRPRPSDPVRPKTEQAPAPKVAKPEIVLHDVPRPPDPIGEIIVPPAKRVSAVQRVLTDYGYGQLNPNGILDRDTQEAIMKFERARRLPVTRQITPTLIRELSVLAGRPIE